MVLPFWVFWLALAAMLVGLVGVILPAIPGVFLIWTAALGYAIADRFSRVDPFTFTVLTLLAVAGVTADIWATHVGARAGGASVRSLLIGLVAAAIGALAGFAFLGIGAGVGAIIGGGLGIFFAEWHRLKDIRSALRAGGGWLVGCTLSAATQLTVAVLMILIFIWQALTG
jgi:uncharacterized protein YqgC (DUF456 family)